MKPKLSKYLNHVRLAELQPRTVDTISSGCYIESSGGGGYCG